MRRVGNLLDRFLPAELAHAADRSALHRGRALAAILLLTFANGTAGILMLLLAALIEPASWSEKVFALALGMQLSFLLCLWLLKQFAAIRAVALLSAGFITLTVTSLIAFTGGLHQSPLTSFLFVQPFVLFIVLGRRAGLTLLLIDIGLALLLAGPLAGRSWVLTEAMAPFARHLWAGPIVAIFACFWYLDHVNRRLTAAIAHERDLAQFAAGHDGLTGLLNRASFDSRLDIALSRADLQNIPLTLLLIDLDGFKEINDSFGHQAGDHLLQCLAARLREGVRQGDSVARLGGDEFALLLEGHVPTPTVDRILADLLNRLAAPVDYKGAALRVSASVGGAVCPYDARDQHALMRCADIALYQAKDQGRNTAVWFDAHSPVRQGVPG